MFPGGRNMSEHTGYVVVNVGGVRFCSRVCRIHNPSMFTTKMRRHRPRGIAVWYKTIALNYFPRSRSLSELSRRSVKMATILDLPKPRIICSMMSQYINKPVCFVGRVEKVRSALKGLFWSAYRKAVGGDDALLFMLQCLQPPGNSCQLC